MTKGCKGNGDNILQRLENIEREVKEIKGGLELLRNEVLSTIKELPQSISAQILQQLTQKQEAITQQRPQEQEQSYNNNNNNRETIIYVYRDESANSCCPRFSHELQEYLNQFKTQKVTYFFGIVQRNMENRYIVKEISGIDAIGKEGIVLVCGFTASARTDAANMLCVRDLINRRGNCNVAFVMFRFGENAAPAKVIDESRQSNEREVQTFPIYFDSAHVIFNHSTKQSIDCIVHNVRRVDE